MDSEMNYQQEEVLREDKVVCMAYRQCELADNM